MSTPYAAYTREITGRMQARMHSQSFTEVYRRWEQRLPTAVGKMAEVRINELKRLQQEHMRTFDATLRAKAVTLLQALPLKSTSEDPNFAYTLTALRLCGYFNAVSSPATFSLLNHITRHTFLLDAETTFQVIQLLEKLHHPQTAEVLQILLPRLGEVADDLAPTEARLTLQFLAAQKLLTVELSEKLTRVMQDAVPDMSVWDLTRSVRAIDSMTSPSAARAFLQAATPALCKALREAVVQRHYYKSLYSVAGQADTVSPPSLTSPPQPPAGGAAPATNILPPAPIATAELQAYLLEEMKAVAYLLTVLPSAVVALSWAPRQLMNEMVRTALAWTAPEDVAMTVSARYGARHGRGNRRDGALSHATTTTTTTAAAAVESEEAVMSDVGYARHLAALPQVDRLHLSRILRALHHTSYRHPAGLRLLSARVAALELSTVAPDTSSSTAASSSHSALADFLAVSVEAVAYFYATDCLPAVVAMVHEIRTSQLPACEALVAQRHSAAGGAAPAVTTLTGPEKAFVETVLLRSALSAARLLTVCGVAAGTGSQKSSGNAVAMRAVDPAMTRDLCAHTAALLASNLMRVYLQHARWVGQHRLLEMSTATRRSLAGAAHALYSIAVLFQTLADGGAEAAAVLDDSTRTLLQRNLRDMVQLVQCVAETKAEALTKETLREVSTALEMVRRHPEWLDTAE